MAKIIILLLLILLTPVSVSTFCGPIEYQTQWYEQYCDFWSDSSCGPQDEWVCEQHLCETPGCGSGFRLHCNYSWYACAFYGCGNNECA